MATDRQRDVWAALGDATRRAIVLMLAAGPMSVGDLAAQLPVTRPAVSQHLKVLKDAGLVSEDAVGTRRVYRLDSAGVAALREQLDDFWNQALGGFQSVVERPRRGKK
ncbi:MAG: metalloregulator ArsR/SmtB family transcription factor [Vicinamibacteraceae bacterium]